MVSECAFAAFIQYDLSRGETSEDFLLGCKK